MTILQVCYDIESTLQCCYPTMCVSWYKHPLSSQIGGLEPDLSILTFLDIFFDAPVKHTKLSTLRPAIERGAITNTSAISEKSAARVIFLLSQLYLVSNSHQKTYFWSCNTTMIAENTQNILSLVQWRSKWFRF